MSTPTAFKKIGDLAPAAALTGTEVLEAKQAGSSVQVTAAALVALAKTPVAIQVACSDEATAITAGTAKVTFRVPAAFTLSEIRASLSTASSSGLPTIDVKMGGVSLFSTLLTIDVTEKTSKTAATAAVLSTTAINDDAEITVDVTVTGTGATGLKVALLGTR